MKKPRKDRTTARLAAEGHGEISASPARFLQARFDVGDYAYIECEDISELTAQAECGMISAHRLCHCGHPFEDELAALNHAMEKSINYKPTPRHVKLWLIELKSGELDVD